MMQYQQEKSDNGLDVLFLDAPGQNAASIQIWFRAGSALEKRDDQGIAHFLEHMFFKGTPKRSGDQIASEVESLGGEINAFTSFDYTCYYINTPITGLLQGVDILLDMVANPLFKEEELIPERDVVFEEYLGALDDPTGFAFLQLQHHCFPKRHRHPILGVERTIKNFRREQLMEFRKNFYNRSNCLLAVAGDLKKKQDIRDIINRYSLPEGSPTTFPRFALKSQPSVNVHKKDVHHGHLYLILRACPFDSPKAPIEDVALHCLGRGDSSRLHQGLVEQDVLADKAVSSTTFMSDGGYHTLSLLFPYQNLTSVLRKLGSLVLKAVNQGFDPAEIEKIKNQFSASKIYDRESLENFTFSLGHSYAQNGDIESDQKFVAKVEETSPQEINRSLRDIFSRPLHMSLQIPENEDSRKARNILESFRRSFEEFMDEGASPAPSKVRRKIQSQFDVQTQHIKLNDRVALVHKINTLSPTFVLHAYIRSGQIKEDRQTAGVHQMLANIISRGHSTMDNIELQSFLENLSVDFRGFAGRHSYGVTMHGQSRHFHLLVPHFIQTLLSPSIKPDALSYSREKLLRALEKQKKDPYQICFQQVNENLFEGHPYAKNIKGTPSSLKRFTRKSLLDKHLQNLRKEQILITCCGDIQEDQLLSTLEPLLRELSKHQHPIPYKKKFVFYTGRGRHLHTPFDREQTQLFMGIPTRGLHHRETIPLKILTTHLSRQTGELFTRLREKQGLCYATYPVHYNALEGGFLGLYVASGRDKIDESQTILRDIIENLQQQGLTQQEFETAKTMLEGKELLHLQTNEDYAQIYSLTTLYGFPMDYYHKELEKIRSLSYQDFQVALFTFIRRDLTTIRVGH